MDHIDLQVPTVPVNRHGRAAPMVPTDPANRHGRASPMGHMEPVNRLRRSTLMNMDKRLGRQTKPYCPVKSDMPRLGNACPATRWHDAARNRFGTGP